MKNNVTGLRHLCAIAALSLGSLVAEATAAEMKVGYFEQTATITLVGKIVKGDYGRFRSAISEVAAGGGIVSHLYIFSPGGSVDEALKIGNLVSNLAMTTVAPSYDPAKPAVRSCNFREHMGKTTYTDYKWTYNRNSRIGDRRCNCASACFLIWAAGARRSGNYLGVHRTFFRPELFKLHSYKAARDRYVKVRKRVEAYLEQMNVPNLVVDTMFSIGSTNIEPLAPNFVRILQGGPALDEYLRAHCPLESRSRDQRWQAYEGLRDINASKTKVGAARKAYDQAYQAAFRCEINVRRQIFKDAWTAR